MTKVSNAAVIAAGREILTLINSGTVIPYVNNGMSLQGMDCQGLVEYCLIKAGVPKAECGLAGSNAHWRAASWRGTPEEMRKVLGAVPAGACPCIHAYDGGEVAKGYHDAYGNCSHIGLYLGGSDSVAASAGRERVIASNFKGKTVPNGGWNAVILLPWVNYGLTAAQIAALGAGSLTPGDATVSNAVADDEADGLESVTATATPAVTQWGVVVTPDGNPVKAREQPKRGAITKFSVPNGTLLMILGESNGYYKVMWLGKARWVQTPFVQLAS
ncbi:MAG: hypothetical protein VB087_07980 [Candidatus Limiplasma sp.]|nr:hypothetical protein [Candidatus Limiplasma sp.]MEA5144912.1 hypothetical protein [Candidatus Limiplasma sp.]